MRFVCSCGELAANSAFRGSKDAFVNAENSTGQSSPRLVVSASR